MPIRVEGAPVQQEKERRASVLRVKLRFRREEKAAVELVRDYVEAKDFDKFVLGLVVKQREISRTYGEGFSALTMRITDRLHEEWEQGNRVIIEESARHGIEPRPNIIGVRLQAGSCLDQLLKAQVINKTEVSIRANL